MVRLGVISAHVKRLDFTRTCSILTVVRASTGHGPSRHVLWGNGHKQVVARLGTKLQWRGEFDHADRVSVANGLCRRRCWGDGMQITPSRVSADELNSPSTDIRLMIVDSRPLVRWALAHISGTEDGLRVVAESESPAEAGHHVFALRPNVVTVECPRLDSQGWQLVRELRAGDPDVGIVVLCSEASDDLIFRALDAGASAFLAKSASVHEVVGAIRHAAVAPSSFTAAGLAQALRRRNQSSDRLALSARERQVLALLREGNSVREVAATLFVSLSTAKTYVARLYEKLGANNRAQALMTAVELGILETQHGALAG